MKKTTINFFLFFLGLGFAFAQTNNLIELTPTGAGSEGNSFFTDQTTITISAGGVVSLPGTANDDWAIAANTGTVTIADALSQTFEINWEGISATNTTDDENFGDVTTQGGIDRAGAGDLGIRTGTGNGIEVGEGFIFSFNATNFGTGASIQITEISLGSFSAAGEEVTFVNRLDTSKKLVATSTGSGSNGYFDVSALDLYVRGGTNVGNLLSVFGSGGSAIFRINGIKFNILDSSTLPNIWIGRTTDFGDTQNWLNNVLPTDASNVTIQNYSNEPVIFGSRDYEVNNFDVAKGTDLEIRTGGTLIVNGTSTGDVVYRRDLADNADTTKAWYLMGSPVAGVTFNDDFVANNDIAANGLNRGVATYNTGATGAAAWTYLQSGGAINNTPGVGYSVKITPDGNSTAPEAGADGRLYFTGTINTTDISPSLNDGNGFYLLANPYTSFVNSGTFLGANGNVDSQIWLWNQASEMYEVKGSLENFMLAPGQGFFVNLTGGTSVTFAESNQSARPGAGDTFQKNATTKVRLLMNDGENYRFARLIYSSTATKGFDNGWEGETFGGIPNKVSVFTELVADNVGKKYQLQSLPNTNMENTIVPIGIKADAGKEITFSTETLNLPSGIKVYLEDREANISTRFDEANSSYKVTLNSSLNGTGRFYLHTRGSALSTDNVSLDNISIYKLNSNTLRVSGITNDNASIKLFNILGKQVLNYTITSKNNADVSLPVLSTGVYIVQLSTEKGKLTKKIVLD